LLLERRGMPNPFDDTAIRNTFQAIIDGISD